VHGFERGGFLVDAGKRSAGALAPLAARIEFPEQWRIVLVLPAQELGLHGPSEKEAFRRLGQQGGGRKQTEALCRIVLLGILPALAECDFAAFGEALYDFNVRSGELFAPVQGGVYASPAIAELVAFVRGLGIAGVGQSSWGPGVFAITRDHEQAVELSKRLGQRFADAGRILITQACNRGAMIAFGEEDRDRVQKSG
jgi:beta-RFAP synthase